MLPVEPHVFAIGLVAALCIGLSKAGFSGISLVAVVLLADTFGARASVGLALPMLIAADLMAVRAFLNHGSWKPVWKLMPPTLLGLLGGWWLLGTITDDTARRAIGLCVLAMVLVQGLRRIAPDAFQRLTRSRAFAGTAGISGGVATMLANAAGPIIQLYLLAREIPKMELLGIAARFFLLVNLIKVPMNAQLDLINPASLLINLWLLPAIAIGVVAGRWLVTHVPQRLFEWLIHGFAVLAAARLLFY
ncbi:MAG: TSUP family transporter [Luteolibacter sp.]